MDCPRCFSSRTVFSAPCLLIRLWKAGPGIKKRVDLFRWSLVPGHVA